MTWKDSFESSSTCFATSSCPSAAPRCLVRGSLVIPLGQDEDLALADGDSFSGRVARIADSHSEWRGETDGDDETGDEEWGTSDTYLLSAVGPMISTPVRPPPEWLPWLDAATQGGGLILSPAAEAPSSTLAEEDDRTASDEQETRSDR